MPIWTNYKNSTAQTIEELKREKDSWIKNIEQIKIKYEQDKINLSKKHDEELKLARAAGELAPIKITITEESFKIENGILDNDYNERTKSILELIRDLDARIENLSKK
ncbi:hypothetical protein [Mycoplasmopsis agassizii]|uniref:Uncharacterized protein n=1 Tax=Mycoplasmopsis agassizii TaxID=33922 RepID=A0ABX4H5M2_9BACT|nr:hypothetical protein [Mycoplasmopsis agassizii]PAF55203.1 hypothetical protein CJF60_00755 [Mycoplasmopsis agassizii]SMC18819.1 hypothetical protein SAMN02745179_00781 [Mycoplasmopsis agassizii]